MIKTIMIGNKPYEMKANLRIYETFKNLYGLELAKVIEETNNQLQNIGDNIGEISAITLTCLKIAHVMIKENNNNFMSLEEWEKELDDDVLGTWLGEVLALAFSPFQRRIPQDHREPNK